MDNYKRREFIKLSALGFAGVALQLNAISTYAQSANAHLGRWNRDTKMNWDAFLERLTQLAKTQHELPWDQDLYTEQVKQLLLKCNFPEFQNIKKEFDSYENENPNMAEAAALHREVDFQVALFQFEKGEYIAHHDHPDMTGVINVVSGNLLAKNYSVEEQLATTREIVKNGRKEVMQQCTIREVENEINKSGDVSILTAHEGNIHSIMPNEFTQLVDVFTPAYTPETHTRWYTVNEDGFYLGQENVFEAEYILEDRAEIIAIELSKTKLDGFVGTYKTSRDLFFKISRTDNQLSMERTRSLDEAGTKSILIPYEGNKFWIENQDARCVFDVKSENDGSSMTIFFTGGSMTANKME